MEQIYIITETYEYEEFLKIHGAYRSEEEAHRAMHEISKEKDIDLCKLWIEDAELL